MDADFADVVTSAVENLTNSTSYQNFTQGVTEPKEVSFELFMTGGVLMTAVSIVGIVLNFLGLVVRYRMPRDFANANVLPMVLGGFDLLNGIYHLFFHGLKVVCLYFSILPNFVEFHHPVMKSHFIVQGISIFGLVGSVGARLFIALQVFNIACWPFETRLKSVRTQKKASLGIIAVALFIAVPLWIYGKHLMSHTTFIYTTLGSFFGMDIIPLAVLLIFPAIAIIKFFWPHPGRIQDQGRNSIAKSMMWSYLSALVFFVFCNFGELYLDLVSVQYNPDFTRLDEKVAIYNLLLNFNFMGNFFVYSVYKSKFWEECVRMFRSFLNRPISVARRQCLIPIVRWLADGYMQVRRRPRDVEMQAEEVELQVVVQ